MTQTLLIISIVLALLGQSSGALDCSNELYSFEGSLQGWTAGTSPTYSDSSATGMALSTSHTADGSNSALLQFDHSSSYAKAIYVVEPSSALDLSLYDSITYSIWKSGQPTQAAIAIVTGSGYVWFESQTQNLADGSNTLSFNLKASNWKASPDWTFTHSISNLSEVKRIAVLLFPSANGVGSAYLDKVIVCTTAIGSSGSGTGSTSTGSNSGTTAGTTGSTIGFVTAKGTGFQLNKCPFYFAGTNNYYLIYKSQNMVNNVLDAAATLGFNVIRTWGFIDIGGGSKSNVDGSKDGVYFQYWNDGSSSVAYNDGATGLQKLDYAIYAASQRGIRLLIPFVNNWKEFGGMDQYNTWFNLQYHDNFYTNTNAKQAYKNWISHLLNRQNTLSGLSYKNDPAIFGWELANEPRCSGSTLSASSGCSKTTITNWVAEMTTYVKSIDSNHMVGVGDEGFFAVSGSSDWAYNGGEGIDFKANLNLSNVDFGTFHLYPTSWGKDASWSSQYIMDHASASVQTNKPVIMEEFGYPSGSDRLTNYNSWTDLSEQNLAADLFWMLADKQDDGNYYQDYDGFTIYNDGSAESNLLKAHASRMAAKNNGCTPDLTGSGTNPSSSIGSGTSASGSVTGASGSVTGASGSVTSGSGSGANSGTSGSSLTSILTNEPDTSSASRLVCGLASVVLLVITL